MPYIRNELRDVVDYKIDELLYAVDGDVEHKDLKGTMNYVVTCLMHSFKPDSGWNYSSISDVRSCLDGVRAEFERRIAGPYEEIALDKNGDIGIYEDFLDSVEK
jgi:hypothetical protein